MAQYPVRSATELQHACAAALPGDRILIYGGVYDTPSVLANCRGTADRPILFAAADDQWVSGGRQPSSYWGAGQPSEDAPSKPSVKDFAFLIVDNCTHVVIDGLKIRECWPSILFVKDTKFLEIRNCTWRHGTYAIFVKDNSSHLLIEDNEWKQDDSAGHELWSTIEWERAHGGEGADGRFRYYNGGFLSSKAIEGNVIVRRNRIYDAYNGIRMKAGDVAVSVEDLPDINRNVYIYDNDFVRIRDNPIEPEISAYNWCVRHNRLLDCHAWFSFDGVTGGFWYLYGNTGYFRSRQGPPNTFGHTMGRVLKLSYEQRPRDPASEGVPVFPWFVFNNSWHLRCPIVGGKNPTFPNAGEGPDFTTNLDFFNNAFDWCDVARDGTWLCECIDLLHNFDLARSLGTRFDYDICSRPDFMGTLQAAGMPERNGLLASRPIFADSANGNFVLAAESEAAGTGWTRGVDRPLSAQAMLRVQADGSLNRGAIQDYGHIEVADLEAESTSLYAQIAHRPNVIARSN